MSKVEVLIQFQLTMTTSVPSLRKTKRGRRLTKNAVFTVVLTCRDAHSGDFGSGSKVERIGSINKANIRSRPEVKTSVLDGIATTWICTKSFWYLRPMDDCYPLGALGLCEMSPGVQPG